MKKNLKNHSDKGLIIKRCQKVLGTFFLMLGCMLFLSVPTFAVPNSEENATRPVEICFPVSVREIGEKPSIPEKYTIRLMPLESAPLPDSSEGYFDLVLTGESTADFPTVRYSKVGIYRYRIYQIEGNIPGASYDKGLYQVTVTVLNPEKGNNLKAMVSMEKDGTKRETAEFVNQYVKNPVFDEPPEKETIPPKEPQEEVPESPPADNPPENPKKPSANSGKDAISLGEQKNEQNPNTGAPALNLPFAAMAFLSAALVLSGEKRFWR